MTEFNRPENNEKYLVVSKDRRLKSLHFITLEGDRREQYVSEGDEVYTVPDKLGSAIATLIMEKHKATGAWPHSDIQFDFNKD